MLLLHDACVERELINFTFRYFCIDKMKRNSKLDEQVTIDQYSVKIESKSTQIDIVALNFLYTRTLCAAV